MSDKKHTAVQWFVYKIIVNHDKHFIDMYRAEIEEALQMEREQIYAAHNDGYSCGIYQEGSQFEYYNETFGGQDEK